MERALQGIRDRKSSRSSRPVNDSEDEQGSASDTGSISDSALQGCQVPDDFEHTGPSYRSLQKRGDKGGEKAVAYTKGPSLADSLKSSDFLRAHSPTYKSASRSHADDGVGKRRRTTYQDDEYDEEITEDEGPHTKNIRVTNAPSLAAPILRALDGTSWTIFNGLWNEYRTSGGRNRLFSCMDESTHVQLCSWLYSNKYINVVALSKSQLAAFFREQIDILPILQELCTGAKIPKAKSVVQKEYALPYIYPLDIPSENPQPKWAMKIFKEKIQFHRSDEWATLTQL